MIILSNKTDCYDYLVNIYGKDNTRVLDRSNSVESNEMYYSEVPLNHKRINKEYYNSFNWYYILIGNRKYLFHQIKDNIWEPHLFHKINTTFYGERQHKLKSLIEEKDLKDYVPYIETKENIKFRQPLSIYNYKKIQYKKPQVPILSSFNITSIVNVEEIYSEIDMFLGWLIDNPCQIKEPSDNIKIEAKGFDLKQSFRHRM